MQSPEAQSEAAVQLLESLQPAQVPPPQSTSLSPPFFTPSVQAVLMHTLPLPHTAEAQSPPTLQDSPTP